MPLGVGKTYFKCMCFAITNGKADIFSECGLTISVPSDCLPNTIQECRVKITAELNTTITLPANSLLVSGVYNITLHPHIEKMIKPVEVQMEHCVDVKPGQESQLSFVVARGKASKFEYLDGGTFSADPKTGVNYGRIHISSFSTLAIESKESQNITYAGRLYYTDKEHTCRKVEFIVTKNFQFFDQVIILPCNVREATCFSCYFFSSSL